jgi:hypothetical protein
MSRFFEGVLSPEIVEERAAAIARAARVYYDQMSGKRRRKRQGIQNAEWCRDKAREIESVAKLLKRIDPVFRQYHGGNDIIAELKKRADFLNSLSKNGRPLDVHLVFAIAICLAGLRVLYGNRNWQAIGEKTIHTFRGIIAADEEKSPADWAKRTFKRYGKLMGDKSFLERAMKDGFIRKLLGSDETVIMPAHYFEKIHGYRSPGSVLLREAMNKKESRPNA